MKYMIRQSIGKEIQIDNKCIKETITLIHD